MADLEDQFVTVDADDLIYEMGKPVNVYDQIMQIEIQAGFADIFVQLDPYFNRFIVEQGDLSEDLVGSYLINVIGTYEGLDGTEKLKKSFVLTILPPVVQELPGTDDVEEEPGQ